MSGVSPETTTVSANWATRRATLSAGEPLQLDHHVVQADGKRGQAVEALGIAGGFAHEAGVVVGCHHRHTRDGSPLFVRYSSDDAAGRQLREHRHRRQQNGEDEDDPRQAVHESSS
jgi:hypothetical protein